ncbi:unnamed protein product [Closterium sp. NIES-54]
MEGMAGAAEEAVEEAEGVAVEVGVVPGVGASVAAVEVVEAAAEVVEAATAVVEAAAAVVEAAAAVAEVAVAVVLVKVQPRSVEALVVASASSSHVPVRPRRPSSFVSGTLGVGGLGALTCGDLLRQNVAIFDLDFDAIFAAMYALTDSAEGDCYLSVPPDPGIEAAALGASASAAPGAGESAAPSVGESALSGTAPTEAFHTFTLESGASRSFFRDSTTLTLLSRPVAISLADPSWGPVLAHSSTVLPCRAAPSGLLSGLHLPSFSTNLRVTHCTCSWTGHNLATLTRRPGSSLYTLTTASPPVSASGQVAASSQVFAAASRSSLASAPCSFRPLSHETLLWHHRLAPPSLPRLRGMASRTRVSGLPRSLLPLPPRPAPTCVPCVEGRQRAAPHSSTFPLTEAPLQTLHMDVWGPAHVLGQGHERYFLLVVDDYSRYTTVFPLRSKGEVTEGIRQTFTLPTSPQKNGIAERRIGMVMDVARTSMIHAAAPHFQWLFAVQYAAHQINLQPRVSLPETTPTLRWTGKVGDASAFRVWGSRAFVCDTLADKLSCRAGPAPSGVSQVDPAEPVEVAVDSGAARGAEPVGVGTGGAERGGAEPGGAEPERVEFWVAEPERVEPRGAVFGGAEYGGSPGVPLRREPLSPQRLHAWYTRHCHHATGAAGAGATGGAAGARSAGSAAGAGAAGGAAGAAGGVASAGATGGAAGAGATRGAAGAGATGGAAGAGAAGAAGVGAAGTEAGGAAGVVTRDPGAEGTGAVSAASGGAARPRPSYVPLLQQPSSPLPGPSPYSGTTKGLTERREPESRPVSPVSRAASPVRTARAGRVLRPRPPPVPSTHSMTLHSLRAASPTVLRFLATSVTDPLFESTASSSLVAELVDFAAACCLDYATSLVAESASASVCPPSVGGECAVGTDVIEDRQEEFECFAAAFPHLVSMLLAPEGDPDAPDIPTTRSYVEAIEDNLVFATADTEALAHVKSELQKRHTCTDLGELTSYLGLRITRDRAQRTISLTHSHMVQQVLQRFGFTYSWPQSTPLPTGHLLSAPPSDESVEPSGPYPELVGCLMYLMTCTRPDLAYPLSLLARYVAPGRHRKTFTLPESPRQNGIAERRIGMVMDVARTSMMHAAAPHFLWPFAVRYAAHQINLQPRVSMPETSPALLWTGKVGDASAFCVWGSRAFVRDLSADKLSPRAAPCVFLGFPPDAPGWQFYHPTSRRVLSSQDVTFDESVPYYRLFPYCTPSLPPPPLFLVPGPPPVDPLPPQGPAPSGVSQVDAVESVEVTGNSGAAEGAEPGGADSGGAERVGATPGGAEPEGATTGGAEPQGVASGGATAGGAEPGGTEPGGAPPGGTEPGGEEPEGVGPAGAVPGGSPGASSRREQISPQELRQWFSWRWRRAAGAGGAACTGGSVAAEGAGATGPEGARPGSTGAAGPAGTSGAGAAAGVGAEATAVGPGGTTGAAGGTGAGAATGAGAVPAVSGVAARPRPYYVPLLQQVLGLPSATGPPPLECPQPVQSQLQLQPASPLPAPSPYTGPTGGLTERREPVSRPALPVRAARTSGRASRQHPPPVPGTHRMSLRPSTAPLRAPLPSPPESPLPSLADPESDSLRAASPTVPRLLATAVTDPSFQSTTASALVAELVDFAARCRLDYAASLVAESESVCPPSVGDPDALDIPTPRSYAEAIEGPYSSQWQAAMDAEMASWKSTGTYVDEVPPPGANIVSGMWIFRVKRPPGSPPVFKARYVARGFSQRQGVDYFQTFSPTPKMTM